MLGETKTVIFFQVSEVEVLSARNELKLAVRRAEDLQVSKITPFTTAITINAYL